jgi:hypothetical protein
MMTARVMHGPIIYMQRCAALEWACFRRFRRNKPSDPEEQSEEND